MRLTCPNCAAQYEVPDDVIPEEGRDVQCSNCGTTWFEPGAGTAAASSSAVPETAADPEETTEEEATFFHGDEAADQNETQWNASQWDDAAQQEDPVPEARPEEDAQSAPEPSAPRPQRGLDPALTDILREEAEREASLRAAASAASGGLESQPNLGLDDLPESDSSLRARQAKDRMARIQGQDPRQIAAEESGQRRDILPDIEEINSTLRASDSAAAAQATAAVAVAPRKGGFLRGFSLTVLLFLMLLMVYTNAAKIAEILPQADPYLSAYVTWVDQARLWLDAQVKSLSGT